MSRLFEALQISEKGELSEARNALGAVALLDAAEKDPKQDLGEVRSLHVPPMHNSRPRSAVVRIVMVPFKSPVARRSSGTSFLMCRAREASGFTGMSCARTSRS